MARDPSGEWVSRGFTRSRGRATVHGHRQKDLMQRHSLTTGSERFVLDPRTDPEHTQHDIEEAVRAGGGFVQLALHDGSRTAVLVSPGLFVSLTSVDREDQVTSADEHPGLELIAYDEAEYYGMTGL